jgi:hypothetical protein
MKPMRVRSALWLVGAAPLLPSLIGSAVNIWYNLTHIDPLLTPVPVKNPLGLIYTILRRVVEGMGCVGKRDCDRDRYARPLPCQGVRRVIPPRAACWVVMQMSERGPGDRPRSGRPLVEVMEPTDLRDGHHAPELGRMHLAWLGTVVASDWCGRAVL